MQTTGSPVRVFTLIRGGKPDGTRATDTALRRRRFEIYQAIAEGRTTITFDDVAPWLSHDDTDEAA